MTDHSTILTLCHNVRSAQSQHVEAGHVWLVLESPQKITTFGLWDDPRVTRDRYARAMRIGGYDGSGTHVQEGVELKVSNRHRATWSRRWSLNAEKTAELHALVAKPQVYDLANNNCADWACGVVSALTGVPFVPRKQLVQVSQAMPGDDAILHVSIPRSLEAAVLRQDFADVRYMSTLSSSRRASLPMFAIPQESIKLRANSEMSPGLIMPALATGSMIVISGMNLNS